jgi:phenylacetate-CoA ligase
VNEPATEGLACPEDAHRGVRARDPAFRSEVLHGRLADLDALEGVGVFRLQLARHGQHATAHARRRLLGPDAVVELPRERLERAILRSIVPVPRDDGVPQRTIEPRHDGGLVTDRVETGKRVREDFLDELLGHGRVADASCDESNERRAMRGELLRDVPVLRALRHRLSSLHPGTGPSTEGRLHGRETCVTGAPDAREALRAAFFCPPRDAISGHERCYAFAVMTPRLLARILRMQHQLRAHERWSRRELEVHQAGLLRDLRDHAVGRSALYRELHHGLERRPLHELPIVTKQMLMARFDEAVTVPGITRALVEDHAGKMTAGERLLDRYWVATTSGTTGRRGIFLWDEREWAAVLASYGRAQEWAGVTIGLTRRVRLAVVSSRTPWHQSAVVAATADSPFVPTLRLDATSPIEETVRQLNAFEPEVLVAYASMARVLAEEKVRGRLGIAPRAVICASEVLAPDARRRVAEAFGTEPFDVYAATETAGIASECEHHRMHLYEDLVIPEVVDEKGHPVPPGTAGARLLVTVLFSRTLPLIRYEMSDCLELGAGDCACGRRSGSSAPSRGVGRTSCPSPTGAADRSTSTPTCSTRCSIFSRRRRGRWSRTTARSVCWSRGRAAMRMRCSSRAWVTPSAPGERSPSRSRSSTSLPFRARWPGSRRWWGARDDNTCVPGR